ncbi:MAG: NAD(P)H-quinone oxidoreductase subunit 4, partial [Thermostichus sp. BF3_bins_97]
MSNPLEFPWLTTLVLLPMLAAFGIPLIPQSRWVRWYALAVGVLDLGLMIYAFGRYYDLQNFSLQLAERYAWVPQIGFDWSLAVDGLSFPLVLLSGLITTLSVVAAWNVTNKPRLFFFLLLLMYSAQVGVFLAQDMLLFFLMWEIELVPVYLLISIWGGPKRQYAATKFILYTAAASIFILVGSLAMAFYGEGFSLDMAELSTKHYPIALELFVYAGLLIAFGVKLPISMILAGVLLKMGGYGLIRMNVGMLSEAHVYFAPVLAVLGVVNIIYGALAAFGQSHLKRRLAYSSIAHMGFVLIGISAFTELGINGALLQMISHGLIAAALFFLTGITYERTHTLSLDKLGGLAKQMPKAFALFTAGSLASLALPGMSGFVGELTVFLGLTTSDAYTPAFKAGIALLAAVGIILTPIYLLSMLRQVFYGAQDPGLVVEGYLGDVRPREMAVALCLLLPIIGIGLYPRMATQTYDVTAVAVASQVRSVLPTEIVQHPFFPFPVQPAQVA